MSRTEWEHVGSVDPTSLIDTTLQLHWAAQVVASAGQTFAEPRSDDSHRAMRWAPDLRAFVGSAFAGPYPFRVALRPEDLTLMLVDRPGEVLGALPLAGSTLEEAYEWLSLGMATYMGGTPPSVERPEYDLPPHPVADGAHFSSDRGAELGTLAALFSGAASALSGVVEGRSDASPVLCWPHHFDLATLITVETDAEGVAAKTIGVGLAPMGGGYPTWYWYVSPWPYPDRTELPELASPGAWHTQGWTGAVLTGESVAAVDHARRSDTIRDFLAGATEAAARVLA